LKQVPSDLKSTAEGGDWSPREMQSNLRPPVARVKRALQGCQGIQWSGDSPAQIRIALQFEAATPGRFAG
jgi:hypothetical protein